MSRSWKSSLVSLSLLAACAGAPLGSDCEDVVEPESTSAGVVGPSSSDEVDRVYARWIARGDPLDFEWLELRVGTRLRQSPRDLAIWAELARLHLDRAVRDEDASALRRVALLLADADRIAGDSAELELVRGLHAQLEGRHPEAVEAWQRAVDLDPTLGEARLRLGVACLEHRDFARAGTQLEAYVEREPDDAEGWLALGVAYAHTNALAQARAAYERAAELAPDDPRPHWNLAWIPTDWDTIESDWDVMGEYDRRREHLADLLVVANEHPLGCEAVALPDPQCLAALERRRQLEVQALDLGVTAAEAIDALEFLHDHFRSPPPRIDEAARAAEDERRKQLLELERAAVQSSEQ